MTVSAFLQYDKIEQSAWFIGFGDHHKKKGMEFGYVKQKLIYRFCHEVQIGDYVVYPSKSDRMINIGEINGDYEFVPDAHEYVQQRNVKWLKHIPRTSFSQGALYEIGSALSFFAVKNYSDEFLSALDKGFKKHSVPYGNKTVRSMGS